MGIFSSIKNAIFGEAQAAPITSSTEDSAVTPSTETAAGTVVTPASETLSATSSLIDVAAILDQAVKDSGQKLDWKHSIVDLLKALKIDSSLSARKELAAELEYSGDVSDSATLNVWLHKAVIKKLSENGGKVPAELLD